MGKEGIFQPLGFRGVLRKSPSLHQPPPPPFREYLPFLKPRTFIQLVTNYFIQNGGELLAFFALQSMAP